MGGSTKMSQLGLGVMIGIVRGNDTKQLIVASLGKTIKTVEIVDNTLHIAFTDGTTLSLWDGGQSCCEHRYMNTDDNLDEFVGARFMGAEVRAGGAWAAGYDVEESQFLIVHTSLGEFTVVNYNRHNGYYGGFWIVGKISTAEK